jgi:hypothetical protein
LVGERSSKRYAGIAICVLASTSRNTMSAPLPPIMIATAFVLRQTAVDMIEALTTAAASSPMRDVEVGDRP